MGRAFHHFTSVAEVVRPRESGAKCLVTPVEKKAALILTGIAAGEGAWLVVNLLAGPARFAKWAGFSPGQQQYAAAWVLALAVAGVYVLFSARLPSVRANLLKPGVLKLLAIAVALAAGFCEEAVFRKLLMDGLAKRNAVVQAIASGLAFGAVHAVWGLFRGSVRAALGAMIATGSLGALLALVYLAGRRNLAPCVAAHFLINLFAEPGLVLAALSGEMRNRITS